MSIIVMISAQPDLSSEPSSVVPSAVMMSSPIRFFRSGFFATVMTCVLIVRQDDVAALVVLMDDRH